MYTTFSFNHLNGSTTLYFNGKSVLETYLNLTGSIESTMSTTNPSFIGLNAVTHDSPFHGLIDRLFITFFVKSADEIRKEATLLYDYEFDGEDPNYDSGPIGIKTNSQNVYISRSNNRSSALFNASNSYFQTAGFTFSHAHYYEFSITFWLRLNIMTSLDDNSVIAVLQLTSLIDGLSSSSYTCIFSLHISPENSTMRVVFPALFSIIDVNNWPIENNTWVHLGIAFNGKDTFYFYKNGQLIGNDTNRRYSTLLLDDPRLALTIGGVYLNDYIAQNFETFERMTCFAKSSDFNYTSMHGEIDELITFGRLLTESEFADLALS
ncbi:unnamed protein product [Rotaria sp. Silwood2]|nr:unnamed protein product [Rotaria sp. Silwood2]